MHKCLFSLAISGIVLISACNKVPFTNRKQVKLLGSSEMNTMSFDQYNQFLQQNPISTNQEQTRLIKTVGQKLSTAVTSYFKKHGMSKHIEGFKWEFNLVENNQVNAWCMPGGKVVFYTGIMPYCKDEEGVAVVMGHEIAHAVAKHGNERMSQGMIAQLGGVALQVAVSQKPEATQNLFMQAYGIGAQVGGVLPFSRLHEKEADKMGMIIMAIAGYDPARAPEFWKGMNKGGGNQPPEFLSTHPSHETRIKELKAFVPEALTYRK